MTEPEENRRSEKTSEPLLEVRRLKKFFPIYKGILSRHEADVRAVDNVSFTLKPGETLGLVGESGCGKTTVGRCILRLLEPSQGEILFRGENILDFGPKKMMKLRREIQPIFQDPYSSLNPRKTVADIIGEALLVHGICKTEKDKKEQVANLLNKVGLSSTYLHRYPHEFSGGQRQRIGIARAIALNPSVIVCDESVSALDVSVQAQVLNLLIDLKQEIGLSYIFIAHDLSVVRHVSDKVAVMYLGQVAEIAPTKELFENPRHPYTRALLSALPRVRPRERTRRVLLEGDVPTPINPPPGCYFSTRCPEVLPICKEIEPSMKWVRGNHVCKCHLVDDRRRSDEGPPGEDSDRRTRDLFPKSQPDSLIEL
jgi:oligopeptide transport system ATP-binding protein